MRVLFSGNDDLTRYRRRHGWRGVAWAARRHPALLFALAGGVVIERLGGRPSHVMIEQDGVVLDYGFRGTRFWPTLAVGRQVERSVEVPGITNLTRWEGRRDGGVWTLLVVTACYLIMYASGGRIRLRTDCISVARSCLADAGVEIPRWIWTARQLLEHLDGAPAAQLDAGLGDGAAGGLGSGDPAGDGPIASLFARGDRQAELRRRATRPS
jgi:hypothetical protein